MVMFTRHSAGELSQDRGIIKVDPVSQVKLTWTSDPSDDFIEISLAPDATQDVSFAGGKVVVAAGGFVEGTELAADPAAPAANKGRLFFKDNGAGKTQLVARFPTGANVVIATEP